MTNISRSGVRQVTKNGTCSSPADARRGKLLEQTYIILFAGKCQQLLITWFIGKILIFNNGDGFHAFLCVLRGSAGKTCLCLTYDADGAEKSD